VEAPSYVLSPLSRAPALEGTWPTLFFGRERLPEIQRKLAGLEWAQAGLKQLEAEAEQVMKAAPQVPLERVGWRHDFFSHATCEHLLYEPASPERFLVPSTGEYEATPAQHRAWVLLRHEQTARQLHAIGLLYALTGESKYAEWVREGLLRVSEFFARRDLRNHANHDALFFQPLYDAQFLLLYCTAYGFTRAASCYSAADRQRVEKGIFAEGMPYQRKFLANFGVHNMACYVAAAIAYCGWELDRPDWLEVGLKPHSGWLERSLREGLPSTDSGEVDGLWYEGTLFYHFYALCPLVTLVELRREILGEALLEDLRRRLEAMFLAPWHLADPDLRLPPVGDLGVPLEWRLDWFEHLYEYAGGVLNPERFAPITAALAERSGRRLLYALAFGPDELPAPATPPKNTLLPAAQIGVARQEGACLWFKAGAGSGGHSHPDCLQVLLSAPGGVVAPDLGTAGYALQDFHRYVRSALAHNTLVVEGVPYKPGAKVAFDWQTGEGLVRAEGRTREVYQGVEIARRLWWKAPFLVLVDSFSSGQVHNYGWSFQAYGDLAWEGESEKLALDEPPPAPLADFFEVQGHLRLASELKVTWHLEAKLHLGLRLKSRTPFEAWLGKAAGNPRRPEVGEVYLRTTGEAASFQACFELYAETPLLEDFTASPEYCQLVLSTGERLEGPFQG